MSSYVLADDTEELKIFEAEITKHLRALDPTFVLDNHRISGVYANRTLQLCWAAWRLSSNYGKKANPLREGDHQMFMSLAVLFHKEERAYAKGLLGNPYLFEPEPPPYNPRPLRYSYGNPLPSPMSILRVDPSCT